MAADPFAALNKSVLKAFGKAVSYQQGAAAPISIKAVPMKDSDEEQHVGGLYTRLFLNMADLPTPPDHGDVVTIDGQAYTVFEPKADAMGGATLSLRAVA
ncbi:MAG TPA: hypothetical protein VFA33_06010 [Bryobacteraceae bacterium]|nr:hypothetical protein [Bryobacteraceae bacterium]